MKKILTTFCAGVLMSALCAGIFACNDNGGEMSEEQRRIELAKLTDDVYYVAGYHAMMVERQDDGTAKCGMYLFISDNLRDTVSVYNYIHPENSQSEPGMLLDGIFEFPSEIMPGNICGYVFFPDEYRYTYPVTIESHRPLTETEEINTHVICNTLILGSNIQPNKYIVVESLSKIE
jgi:hypothetical protein